MKSCLLLAARLSEMALLKFLVRKNDGSDTLQLPSISLCASKDVQSADESVLKKQEVKKPSLVTHKVSTREKYNGYTPEQRMQIAKYAAVNRPRYYVL